LRAKAGGVLIEFLAVTVEGKEIENVKGKVLFCCCNLITSSGEGSKVKRSYVQERGYLNRKNLRGVINELNRPLGRRKRREKQR